MIEITRPTSALVNGRIKPLLFELLDEALVTKPIVSKEKQRGLHELQSDGGTTLERYNLTESGIHRVQTDNGEEVWIDAPYILYQFVLYFAERIDMELLHKCLTVVWKEVIGKEWREETNAKRTMFTLKDEKQEQILKNKIVRGNRYYLKRRDVDFIIEQEWHEV